MSLKNQIQQDMLEAMKAKEEIKLSALRMLKAAILKWEVSGSEKKEATDEDILQLIGKEVKQRKDSIEQFKNGNRPELAAKEEAEMAVLQEYLPRQLTEDEIKVLVEEAMDKTGAVTRADMGKLMGHLMPMVKGKADGGIVSRIVNSLLKQE